MSSHKIISNVKYSDTCYKISLERNNIEYNPGSCASIHGKSYSFCSSPTNNDTIEFIYKKFNNGVTSTYLSLCRPNDNLEIDDVFTFFYPGQTDKPYCYIATGTGIAPFVSALLTYNTKPHTIFYGARTYDDLYMRNTLSSLCDNVYFAVSQSDLNTNKPKRVTDLLDKIPINHDMIYYVCGIENMITDVSKFLTDQGISYSNIQQEMFYMSL